jgi:predicted RNA-binding protein associated with RNAse of E/G family
MITGPHKKPRRPPFTSYSELTKALDAATARAEKAEAALQKIRDVMREDSNGKDPMDAVEDIIAATKEGSK